MNRQFKNTTNTTPRTPIFGNELLYNDCINYFENKETQIQQDKK